MALIPPMAYVNQQRYDDVVTRTAQRMKNTRNEIQRLRALEELRKNKGQLANDLNPNVNLFNPNLDNFGSQQKIVTKPIPYDIFTDPYREERFRDGSITKKPDVVDSNNIVEPSPKEAPGVVTSDVDQITTVINPADQLIDANTSAIDQIPVPDFKRSLEELVPTNIDVVTNAPDSRKEEYWVDGMPWKVVDKLGGKVIVHNGVEYNIIDVYKDGSVFEVQDRNGTRNFELGRQFNEARLRGILDTEIGGKSSDAAEGVKKYSPGNLFIKNATTNIAEKATSKTTSMVKNMARVIGVDPGTALSILAIETNFDTVSKDHAAKGPLQVQKIAFKDLMQFYLERGTPKSVRAGAISQEKWNDLRAQVATLKNMGWDEVQKDKRALVMAGLLYLKQIELLGVHKNLWGAAYFDGPYKFVSNGQPLYTNIREALGPNGISDENLAKDGTTPDKRRLKIAAYTQAYQILSPYLTEVSNYVPDMWDKNADTTKNKEEIEKVTTDSTVGTETQVDNTDRKVTTDQPLGPKDVELSTITVTKPAGLPDSETIDKKDPNIYLQNPSSIGYDLKISLEKNEYNNRIFNEMNRMADIALSAGNLESYYNFRQSAADARNAIIASNAEVIFLQGMQGLNDLETGSVNRMNAVWSEYAGRKVRIIPRTDGLFDIRIDNELYAEGISKSDLKQQAHLVFDSSYRASISKVNAERALEVFKFSLNQKDELLKIQGELAKIKTKEMLTAQLSSQFSAFKYDSTIVHPESVMQGGIYGIVNGVIYTVTLRERETVDGEKEFYWHKEAAGSTGGNIGGNYTNQSNVQKILENQ